MRSIAIVLVVLGALTLGYQGFTHTVAEQPFAPDGPPPTRSIEHKTVWLPAVISGIVLVSGLILFVVTTRQEPID